MSSANAYPLLAWADRQTRRTHPNTSREGAKKVRAVATRDADAACARLALHPEGLTSDAFPEHERKRLSGLADGENPRVVRDGVRENKAGNDSTVWKLKRGSN